MTDGPFAMETTYEWSEVGEGTRITPRKRGNPTGFGRVLARTMAAATRRANQKDLEALKRILDSQG